MLWGNFFWEKFPEKQDWKEIQRCASKTEHLQSGRSGLAKHGGAYFSAVYEFMKDPIATPGPYENQEV